VSLTAPFRGVGHWAMSTRASVYLRRAGIRVRRPGSHTFRHSCVQRLVEADMPFKQIATTWVIAPMPRPSLRQGRPHKLRPYARRRGGRAMSRPSGSDSRAFSPIRSRGTWPPSDRWDAALTPRTVLCDSLIVPRRSGVQRIGDVTSGRLEAFLASRRAVRASYNDLLGVVRRSWSGW